MCNPLPILEPHGYNRRARGSAPESEVRFAGLDVDASTALRLGTRLGGRLTSIDDVRIHQLLAAIGHRPRSRLTAALTADLRAQTDWPALRESVVAWCETGFNLVHAATALHIHRNTLVYRLNKIAQVTGRSVRDHRATLALYLACLAEQLDDG
jgi:carbohydrate diacid regulator